MCIDNSFAIRAMQDILENIKTRIVLGELESPKDIEIYQFLLRNFYSLQFSKEQNADTLKNVDKKENPKWIQRKIKKETKSSGIGTKAQMALKKQYEDNKKTRKQRCKQKKEEEIKRKFQLKQKKRKNKH